MTALQCGLPASPWPVAVKVARLEGMFLKSCVAVALVATLAGCSRAPEARQYELKGQILAMRPEAREVTIQHGDIRGFMPGMTMPFRCKDAALLEGKQPGDLVTATLVVGEAEAHLSTLTKTGTAPLEAPIEVTATDGADPDAGRHRAGSAPGRSGRHAARRSRRCAATASR